MPRKKVFWREGVSKREKTAKCERAKNLSNDAASQREKQVGVQEKERPIMALQSRLRGYAIGKKSLLDRSCRQKSKKSAMEHPPKGIACRKKKKADMGGEEVDGKEMASRLPRKRAE